MVETGNECQHRAYMLLHGNLCYKKSVMQKCCSSQVPLGVVPHVAEHETYNVLVVVWSGRTKHAEHGGT